jgi:hypothetical protein
MNNDKILNLTDVEDDDFESIKRAIEEWMDCGYGGKFTFISEADVADSKEVLKGAFQNVYNKGVWHGGLALAGGLLLGTLIFSGIERFMKEKDEEVE